VKGESYISIDRVRENASQLKVPFPEELARVIFHGALHLCGYEDKTKKAERAIRKKEDYYLSKL
jgi:rRNA maturation RNase YbeY